MASSCSWQMGTPIPDGVPRPPGDPVPKIDTHAKGRPADQLHEWAAERAPVLGMPVAALEAYAYAARVAEVENPDCHLAWTTLAGIGQVESHHGTYRGAVIAPNGDVTPPIRGVRLDGTNGNLEIIDDDGDADGEPEYARAMGPMQFIPETWKLYGVDANNDGVISPDNFDDAALSAAGYLCWRGQDPAPPRGWGLARGVGGARPCPRRGVGCTRCARTTLPTSPRAPCGTGRPPTPTDTPSNHA